MRWLLVAWLSLIPGLTVAQLPMEPIPSNTGSGNSYVGPLDAVTGVTTYACYSMRACSKAAALAHMDAFQLRRASDGATQVITLLSNGNADTATAATFCNATTCSPNTWYDQSGNGLNVLSTPPNVTYVASCLNSLPCFTESGGGGFQLSSLSTHAQPYTFVAVGERTGAFTTAQTIVSTDDGSHPSRIVWNNTANTFHVEGTSTISATASDSVWHAFQGVFNGASPNSILYIDGTATTGSTGTGASGAAIQVMQDNGSQPMTGEATEAIIFLSALSSANQMALCKNQQAYWAAGNFGAPC